MSFLVHFANTILFQISELTNEYHYLVPSGEFSYERVDPIIDMDGFYKAKKRVENLQELELAGRLLAAAQFKKKGRVTLMQSAFAGIDSLY